MDKAAARADRSAEEMFFSWLLRLPHTSDVAVAARMEIARMDGAEPDELRQRYRLMLEQAMMNLPITRGRRCLKH